MSTSHRDKKSLHELEGNTNREDGGRPRKRPKQGSEDNVLGGELLSNPRGRDRTQVPFLRKLSSYAIQTYHRS